MNKGFTLLEFIIYFSLLLIISVVMGSMGINVMIAKNKLARLEVIEQNARLAGEIIVNRARGASAIINPAAGQASTSLSLNTLDASKNPIIFDLVNGNIRIKEGSDAYQNITTNEITATNFEVKNISYSGTSGTIRIKLTLKNGDVEKDFYFSSNVYKQ